MGDLDLWRAEMHRARDAEMAKNARCLRLAEMNGIRPELRQHQYLEGTWWTVPAHFVPIVGCMLARVQ